MRGSRGRQRARKAVADARRGDPADAVTGDGTTPSTRPAPTRSNAILIALILFYVAVLGGMVVFDRYLFLVENLVVPVLLLAALLSGRIKAFANDWALF